MIRSDNAGGLHAVDRMDRFTSLNFLAERPFVAVDLLRMICGNVIGSGAFRAVYDFDLIPNAVIKVCVENEANIVEAEIWHKVQSTPYAKWFAPCLEISPGGNFLIQRKTKPLKATDKLPKQLPNFFTDIKMDNFGWIGKQFVCHDYQFIERALDLSFNCGNRAVNWKHYDGKTQDKRVNRK